MTIRERAENKIAAMKKDGWDMSVFEDLLSELGRLERELALRKECDQLTMDAMDEQTTEFQDRITALEREHKSLQQSYADVWADRERFERERDEATNDMKKTLHAATLAEREACAKFVENYELAFPDGPLAYRQRAMAAAIRRRK